MKLRWATDVHLDHLTDRAAREFCRMLVADLSEGDAVVVTGDISNSRQLAQHLRDLATACDGAGCRGYFVLGNHDYYGSSVHDVGVTAVEACGDRLRWLDVAGPVTLATAPLVNIRHAAAALVGVGGWADARVGNPSTPLLMNDFRLIDDLADEMSPGAIIQWRNGADRTALHAKLRALADDDAAHLRRQIGAAVATGAALVIAATHVPPWPCAAMHEGKPSSPDFTPYFVSTATGDVLIEAAGAHPDVKFLVLCGHSHGAGDTLISPNLRVRTGPAEYGSPGVAATFDVSVDLGGDNSGDAARVVVRDDA